MIHAIKYLILVLIMYPLFIQAQDKSVYIEGYDRLAYSVEKIHVKPGATVELTLKTVSSMSKEVMAHNWVLLKKDTDVENFVKRSVQHKQNNYIDPDLIDRIIAITKMLGGGEKDTITFTVPETKGKYKYVCTFPGHYVAGMKGTLVIK